MKDTIKVALFEDQFWNNNSEVYPCSVPHPSLYDDVPDTKPVFISPYTATCILDGEYNAAMYNGVYYQLKKIRLDDKNLRRYKYQLEYDVMMNFMAKGGTIRGTVIRTNNTEWLKESGALQSCKAVLEDPCRLIYGKFEQTDYEWKKSAKLLLPNHKFTVRAPTRASMEAFFKHIENTDHLQWVKDQSTYLLAEDVYIFGEAETVETSSWKNNIVELIKKQYSDLTNISISKATQLSDSPLSTNYCLTHTSESIGTSSEDFKGVTKIDLSNLKDIKPITLLLKPSKPSHKPTKEDLSTEVKFFPKKPNDWIRKLVRAPHLPLKTYRGDDIEDDAYLPVPDHDSYVKNTEYTGFKGHRPQKVEFKKEAELDEPAYLWYLDKADVSLVRGEEPRQSADYDSDYMSEYLFSRLNRSVLPSVGFLLFDFQRNTADWTGAIYTGTNTLKTLKIRTGLSRTLFEKYGDSTGKWWSNLKVLGAKINGNQAVSFLTYDTDLFLWLLFAPKQGGGNYRKYSYHYYDDWGFNNVLSSNRWYTYDIINADINGLGQANPFHQDRIEAWNNRKYEIINSVSIYTDWTPRHEIKPGDIFATSLSHRFISARNSIHYPMSAGQVTIGVIGSILSFGIVGVAFAALPNMWRNQIMDKLFVRDLFKGNTELTDMLNERLVIYSQGSDVKFGWYREYTETFSLSESNNQMVDKVDGMNRKSVTFYHIQSLGNTVFTIDKKQPLTEFQKESLIIKALQISYEGDGVNIHNFTMDALESGTPQLFDLVGTDWYAYVKQGKVHLISKENRDFITSSPKLNSLKIGMHEEIPIYDKINQKPILHIYGETRNLNTKFNLENDEFDIHLTPYELEGEHSLVDYYHVLSENNYDYLNEIIEVPKKTLKATAPISSAELENVRLQIRQQNQNYYTNAWMNELNYNEKMNKFGRDRQDLNTQLANQVFGTIGAGLEVAALTGIPAGIAGKKLSSLFKITDDKLTDYAVTKQTLMTGKYGRGMISSAGRFAAAIPFYSMFGKYHERIDEDEKMFMEKNALEMIIRNQTESQNYARLVQQVNEASTAYVKREVNERTVLEKLKQHGIDFVHMEIMMPTQAQSRKLKEIFEHYGTECNLDNKEIVISQNMDCGIIQFTNLNSESINSLLVNDIALRTMVQTIFENGVKFVKHTHKAIQETTIEIIHHVDEPVEFDESQIDKWTGEEWDRFNVKVPKNEIEKKLKSIKNYGLTDEEYNKYKNNINPEHPYDDINKIMHNRGTGIQVILRPKTEQQKELEDLKKKVTKLESEKITCEEKVKQLEEDKKACGIHKDALEQQKKDLEQQLNTSQTTLKAKVDEIHSLSNKIRDLESQLSETGKVRDLYKDEVKQVKDECKKADAAKALADMATIVKYAAQAGITLEGGKSYEETQQEFDEKLRQQMIKLMGEINQLKDEKSNLAVELNHTKLEKNKISEQLYECKNRPSQVDPGSCMTLEGSLVGLPADSMFPKLESYKTGTQPSKVIINKWPSPPNNQALISGEYAYIYYLKPNQEGTYAYFHKPVVKTSHKIIFIQNLINCLFDHIFGRHSDRLINFENYELRMFSSVESIVYYKFTDFSRDDVYTSNIDVTIQFNDLLSEFEEADKPLVNIITNAFYRSGDTMWFSGKKHYLSSKTNLLPEKTTTAYRPPFIFWNGYDDYLKFVKYAIYNLRTKNWDDAYVEIMSCIEDWKWLFPSSYT